MHRLAPALLTLLCLAACGPKEVSLESGSFTLVRTVNNGEMQADSSVTLTLDLDGDTLEISDAGASQTVTLERVDSELWVEQCPTMRDSQLLEWARLDGPLELDGVSFEAPVLIANCDTNGKWMVDGQLVSTDRAVELGEETWLVDLMPSEELPEPLSFLPDDLL